MEDQRSKYSQIKQKRNSGTVKKVERWTPIDNMPSTLYVEELIDSYNGLKVLLKGEDENSQEFELKFENYFGYRNFNESERLKTINKFSFFSEGWSLFIANGTDFTSWLTDESLGTVDESDIYHIIINSPEDIIEVLTADLPVIRKL